MLSFSVHLLHQQLSFIKHSKLLLVHFASLLIYTPRIVREIVVKIVVDQTNVEIDVIIATKNNSKLRIWFGNERIFSSNGIVMLLSVQN
jgi:hypothetical protein